MMNYWLLLIPVISAFISWACSKIAARILLQQVLPKKQPQLAEKIAKTVSREFSFAGIENRLSEPGNIKKIMPVVESHVDDFLRHKLKAKIPMIGMLIGDKTISSLKEVFMKEIEEMFPQVIKQFTGNLEADLNIESLVSTKINAISPAQFEKAALPVLRYFGLTAVITGFIIGLINLALILLLN